MRSSWTYLLLVATAVVAALISWQVIVSTHPSVPMPEELIGLTQPTQAQLEQLRTHNRWNDTYALMIFGALCMAAGAPLFARGLRLPFQIAAILSAVVMGILAGTAMGGIGFYLYDWLPIKWDALVRVAVRWMAMLLPTGIASALLTIVCQNAWRKTVTIVMGGVIGSIFAALAYSLIAAVFLPTEGSDGVLPLGANCQLLLFTVTPLLIWSTIAHQESTVASTSTLESIPQELEAV